MGQNLDGSFRFFLLPGSTLNKPRQFNGTIVVVQVTDAKRTVYDSVNAG